MFQALTIMELPPDPSNNPHRDRQDEIFRSGFQPIFSDDATFGKRKASLTAAESAKAQKIASILQSDFMRELQRPEEFYRPLAIDLPEKSSRHRPSYYAMVGSWLPPLEPRAHLRRKRQYATETQRTMMARSPRWDDTQNLVSALEEDWDSDTNTPGFPTHPNDLGGGLWHMFTTLQMWFGDHPGFDPNS